MKNVIPIHSLDDPRLDVYRNLKDKALDRAGRLFIAEGDYIVRRLLASDYSIESIFAADRWAREIAPLVPDGVPLYVASREAFRDVRGMKFHSGIMACGRRKPPATLDDVIAKDRDRLTLVVCPDIANAENIGSLIRLAAGFGADAVVLGERCHDPFWRQSIRVSMGTIFKMPLVQSDNLLRDLQRLKTEWHVELGAAVLDEDAEPLSRARRPAKFALLFGNEAQGLSPEYVAACDRRITIPMKRGTDSLNVAVAAGIFLHHFTCDEPLVQSAP